MLRVSEMIHSKKAQPIGQIMMYIIASIVLSLILVYGYNAVNNFRSQADEVIMVKFKSEMSELVSKIASDYGTVVKEVMDTPIRFDHLCFVDLSKQVNNTLDAAPFYLVHDSWGSTADKNTFLVESSGFIDSFYIENLGLLQDHFCLEIVDGRVDLQMSGTGEKVIVSRWI